MVLRREIRYVVDGVFKLKLMNLDGYTVKKIGRVIQRYLENIFFIHYYYYLI